MLQDQAPRERTSAQEAKPKAGDAFLDRYSGRMGRGASSTHQAAVARTRAQSSAEQSAAENSRKYATAAQIEELEAVMDDLWKEGESAEAGFIAKEIRHPAGLYRHRASELLDYADRIIRRVPTEPMTG